MAGMLLVSCKRKASLSPLLSSGARLPQPLRHALQHQLAQQPVH
ncbi:hypothetical protein DLM_1044 [Aquitalea magnusonii]|uniref:Uncharacterized protein n=1 Tax=Aquitalea magnusonii TaxID=332411 RepID=A0A3G9GBD7_9NEIS|nr:hypothetical protein DLM_1044 [Aquitalea magnusonii]